MDLTSHDVWIAVLQIIAIDIVLSGDNAVVIALACRNLPEHQKRKGILWGVAGAVGLRVVLTAFAAALLGYPWIKLAGGVLLLWIGIKLLLPEEPHGHEDIEGSRHLWGAVKTIIVADFIMSLDNVIGVAAAARDSILLLLFGLAVSIPLIVWSSQFIMKMMERHPLVVTLGAGLLGYVAGSMLVSDVAVKDQVAAILPAAEHVVGGICALFIVLVGNWLAWRKASREERRIL